MSVLRRRSWQLAMFGTVALVAGALFTQSGFFARSDLRLVIDLSDRRLDVIEGGTVVKSYEVAVGTASYPTPQGHFQIQRIVWNPPWVPPASGWAQNEEPREPGDPANPMQGVKLYFSEPDYFIHGTNDPQSIGTAASHGCVRMQTQDAVDLARWVMDRGGAAQDDDWFDDVADDPTETEVVVLPDAISLEIQS
jgi:lipoprotein-anchoring transpeptidase ErfK/SrfK